MADEKHLEILRQGVVVWNQWRRENADITPNLEDADIRGFYLYDAYLRRANLKSANLEGAYLISANLRGADLRFTDLRGANLYGADLRGTYLSRADLSRAYLSRADLYGANLYGANFEDAYLRGADLSRAYLSLADLKGADLYGVYLYGANLYGANLYGAILMRIQALDADFQDTTLTGACIQDWNINSQTNLRNVQCDYIYLKQGQQERIPHDPDKIFAPGEFTKRYQQILETVNLYFGNGIDWQVFLNSFQKLQEEEKLKVQEGERELSIVQGIENKGDGSFVIKVGVAPDTDKGEYEKAFWQKYQPMLEAAEERYKLQLDAKDEHINIYRQQNTELLEIIKLKAIQPIQINSSNYLKQGDIKVNQDNHETKVEETINVTNAGIVKNVAPISGNAKIAGVINEAPQKDLSQAAAEIQQLLEQLSKTYPTETFAQKGAIADMTIQEIESNPTLKQKIIKAIKAMGVEAFMEAINHPVANVLRAGIEAYREPN